jgi:hypothetical protein
VRGEPVEAEVYFAGRPVAAAVHERVLRLLAEAGTAVEVRVTRSQVAYLAGRGFAYLWVPGQYLRGDAAPAVLSVVLPRSDASPRWKQVVHPTSRLWMHHLEVRDPADLDDEVQDWLLEAAAAAV